jgi:hypothetical protein
MQRGHLAPAQRRERRDQNHRSMLRVPHCVREFVDLLDRKHGSLRRVLAVGAAYTARISGDQAVLFYCGVQDGSQ